MINNELKARLGVAIVGLTSYAHEQIIPAFSKTLNVYLAGLVSDDSTKAMQWAKDIKSLRKIFITIKISML